MSENERIIEELGRAARAAAIVLATAEAAAKNAALVAIAEAIEAEVPALREANERDLAAGAARGLSDALLDRLRLSEARIADMVAGVRHVATLPDPVGLVYDEWQRPDGLKLHRRRVPIGVIGIVYESRPNVTVDAAALTLKSGNAVILRGGSEAFHSNLALGAAMSRAIAGAGLPADAVQLVPTTDREAVGALLRLDRYLDLVIPRGGEALIRRVVAESRVPVIKHYNGICHVYVDGAADLAMAEEIALNAKVQRPGVCNAMETLLVDRAVAERFLPAMRARFERAGVTLRGCAESCRLLPGLVAATEEDWGTEYLDLVLSLRVVDGLDEAMAHIERYGSRHTDAIVTGDPARARRFVLGVDSSSVMVNASTRFSDGAEYGLGAEIGISTDKLHARGPMGLVELTTYKWVVEGAGHLRGGPAPAACDL